MTPEQLDAEFPLGPDSLPQPGVPAGRLEKFTWSTSRVFPGTVRDCWIYVPAQYDATKPACVFVIQDGEGHWTPQRRWRIPTILDNLIHQRAIPVMIGIFINPGVIPAPVEGGTPRINRSYEYDSLGDRYARFLAEEILPEVGRRYTLAPDGNSRAIMGGSSGAICAFNAAWERPDVFSRVLSIVGSYTPMRGGDTLAALIRVTEPKPLRVFLESGARDFKMFCGDWWTANLAMLASLEYAGYEVNHAWAEHAGHDDYHGSMIFPDALRWLWQDYPRPIKAGVDSKQPLARLTIPGEGWELVAGEYMSATAITAGPAGHVFIFSAYEKCVYRVAGDDVAVRFADGFGRVQSLSCDAAGKLYACQPDSREIVVCDSHGRVETWQTDLDAAGVAIASNGLAYVTDTVNRCVWLITPAGGRRVVAKDFGQPAGVALWTGETQLIVTDAAGWVAHLFTILPDGGLANGAPYFPLHRPGEESSGPTAGGLAVSQHRWIVFATELGLKIVDHNGLTAGILYPKRGKRVDGVAFGGKTQDWLYLTDDRCVYRRKIKSPESLWC
jgi:sugar lactone lactonase YvrE